MPTSPTAFASRVTWHKPLLVLAGGMGVLAVVAAIGYFADPRRITGVPLWDKPLLFAISIGIYALTLSWLLGLLKRWRRAAWLIGTVVSVGLLIEMVIIVGAALADTTSHFNVSTPFAAAMWAVMAVSIVVVWSLGIPVAVMLFRTDLGDGARSLAIRSGVIVAFIGMGLAFLMTGPQPSQLSDYRGIVGAHAVGLADGGPGLPLVGWSTVGGDLRIPHFVGIHALQLIPLAALLLELAARRIPALRSADARRGVIWIIVALYAAMLGVLTGQALAGQSIVHPTITVASVTGALFVGAAVSAAIVIAAANRSSTNRLVTRDAYDGSLSLAHAPRAAFARRAAARRSPGRSAAKE